MTIKKLISFFLFTIILASCKSNVIKKNNTTDFEIWKSEFVMIKSQKKYFIDSFSNHSQYLYLYKNGKAKLVDSLENKTLRVSTDLIWKIIDNKNEKIFSLGSKNQNEEILGVNYPIVKKDEKKFEMLFDSISINEKQNKHIWNLRKYN